MVTSTNHLGYVVTRVAHWGCPIALPKRVALKGCSQGLPTRVAYKSFPQRVANRDKSKWLPIKIAFFIGSLVRNDNPEMQGPWIEMSSRIFPSYLNYYFEPYLETKIMNLKGTFLVKRNHELWNHNLPELLVVIFEMCFSFILHYNYSKMNWA